MRIQPYGERNAAPSGMCTDRVWAPALAVRLLAQPIRRVFGRALHPLVSRFVVALAP
jgi:hypothetical protein